MKKISLALLITLLSNHTFASNVIPVGNGNNELYYKIGGGADYALPSVSDTQTINLNTNTNLGLGYSCSAFNPALSIVNSINDLKNSTDNLEKNVLEHATGAVIALPMYFLAKVNPTLYALLNNKLISANQKMELSTKSCETAKEEISRGENPYQDWGVISVNDQWNQKLSLTSSSNKDMNVAKKEVDETRGDNGVPWVTGNKDEKGVLHAGGKGSDVPPVHAIADTVKAGYNVMLGRPFDSNLSAPTSGSSAMLAQAFPTPQAASVWVTNVVGDQIITTCNDAECKLKQGSLVGHGLLPMMTSCTQDKDNCTDTIREHLGNLVTGHEAITKGNLEQVSTDGTAISPEAISSIQQMDQTQQRIVINKLAQEVAIQRVIDKALTAKNILSTGAQIPVIASNHPAQVIIGQAITNLDNDIRSLTFESQIRKQMMSDTLSQVMSFSGQQQQNAMKMAPVTSQKPLMVNGAISTPEKK